MIGLALLTLPSLLLCLRALNSKRISPFLTLTILIYVALWNIYPLLYIALYGTESEAVEQLLVNNPRYPEVVVITLIGVLLTLSMIVFQRSPFFKVICSGQGDKEFSPKITLILLVASIPAIMFLNVWLEDVRGVGFNAVTGAVVFAQNEELAQIGIIEASMTFLVALALTCATSYRTFSTHKKLIACMAWTVLGIHVLNNIEHGNRAVLLLPVVALLGSSLTNQKSFSLRRGILTFIILFLSVIVASTVAMAIGVVRVASQDRISLDSIAQTYDHLISGQAITDQVFLVATGLYTKFDAYQTGVVLLEAEDSEPRRWSPIVSSLLSPIPRALFPNKPAPTSITGEASGTPYRIAAEPFGEVQFGTVVPVSPVAVAVWEVGYPLLGLWIVANVGYLMFMNSLLLCKSILHRALGFTMLCLPTAEFIFAPISSIVRDGLRNVIYVILLNLAILSIVQIRNALQECAAANRCEQRRQAV